MRTGPMPELLHHHPAFADLEASIAEAETLLRDKRLPRFQREALQRDNERKRRLIAPLKAGAAS